MTTHSPNQYISVFPVNRLRNPDKGWKNLKGIKIKETENATLFEVYSINGHPLERPQLEWFPFSQTKSGFFPGNILGEDVLTVSEWICTKKDLI